MILKRENDLVFLVNDEGIKKLANSIVEANESLRTLSEEVGGANYQTNKMYLFGVVREGGVFILNDEEKKVRKWTKDSPLAEASIRRLVREAREAVPEELVKTIGRIDFNISQELKNNPLANWKDYLDYNEKDSVVCLSPKYYEDNEKLLCREISEGELVDVEDLLEMLPRLQDLSDKGYKIFDSIGFSFDGKPYPINGLLHTFTKGVLDLSEREEIDKDKLVLSMISTRGRSLDDIKEEKRREEE